MTVSFVEHLSARSMPRQRLAAFCLLDELAASPWIFDVLWDVWPGLDITRAGWADLADELLIRESPDLFLRGSAVFDAVTIFEDVVGDVARLVDERREGCRAAYLSLRPTLVRGAIGEPPQPIGALTEERYLTRLAYVTAMLGTGSLDAVTGVLLEAADRYERRGKLDGAQLCRQNVRLLRLMADEEVLPSGLQRGETITFELPPTDAYTLLEFACQWWPVFGGALRGLLRQAFGDGAPPRTLDELIGMAEALAGATAARPGVGSTVAALAVLRVTAGEPPGAIGLLPVEWTHEAQVAVTELHQQHGGTLPQLVAAYQYLIDVERRDRRWHDVESGTDRTAFARLGMLWADIGFKARLRARNELSHDDFAALLGSSAEQIRSTPQIVESILTFGAGLFKTDPSYAGALLEAAGIMAPLTEDEGALAFVRDTEEMNRAATGRPADVLAMADRFRSRGRIDLAVMALYNAAVTLARRGAADDAAALAERGRDLLRAARGGAYLLPDSVDFSAAVFGLRFAQVLSDVQSGRGDVGRALAVASEAVEAYEAADDVSRWMTAEADTIAAALLQRMVAFQHLLGDAAAADAAVSRAREWAVRRGLDSDVVRALVLESKLATERKADPAAVTRPLTEALEFAERARRSLPFEVDKTELMAYVFEPYLWLGEHHIEAGRGWEAVASFEGLRSRALLDLLGLSRALPMPTTLGAETAEQGTRALERVRSMAFPGEASDANWAQLGTRDMWAIDLAELDSWLDRLDPAHRDYAAVVAGRAMDADAVRAWAARADRPTAVVFWYLGLEYSYQAVLLAGVPGPLRQPILQRIPTTIGWLDDAARQVREAVGRRRNPPPELWAELGRRLLDPVRAELEQAEVVHLCPSQALHALPLPALTLGDAPLNTRKEVSVVASLSVLNALQMIDAGRSPTSGPAVFGPEFPDAAARIAQLLGTRPIEPDPYTAAVDGLFDAPIVHLLCHGHHDPANPWESGLVYPVGTDRAVLAGYDIVQWRLQARLAALQACDTRRENVSAADDAFSLGRFLHLAGSPAILLADWDVRADVFTVFMSTFYRDLAARSPGQITGQGRGHAYRAAMRAVHATGGAGNPFLWAPFVLAGVTG